MAEFLSLGQTETQALGGDVIRVWSCSREGELLLWADDVVWKQRPFLDDLGTHHEFFFFQR